MAKKQPKKEGKPVPTPAEIPIAQVFKAILAGYDENATEEGKKEFSNLFGQYLKQELEKHPCTQNYNIVFMFDNTTLLKGDSDNIYKAINNFKNDKPLLLVLLSSGGEPGGAYLIGKLCQEFSNEKFVVVVPRYAKSAATLLSCAANEIHMGSLSELGPIDPQIEGMPTLGLKNSVEHIADLVSKNPEASDMFAKYLSLSIKPILIGYYERVAESAKQYAEKLLERNKEKLRTSPSEVAHKLVYGYMDHGFVIDKTEAENIFGSSIVKKNTQEYELGAALYTVLARIERFFDTINYRFYFIGSQDSRPSVIKKSKQT